MRNKLLAFVTFCLFCGCGGGYYQTSEGRGFEQGQRSRDISVVTVSQLAGSSDSESSLDRKVISTCDLMIETLVPDSVHKEVISLASQYDGYVLKSDKDQTVLRIPAVKFNDVLGDIEQLGKVVKKEITGQDVTEEYNDLGTRIDNAEKTRLRYLDLLKRANTVDEILKVERELERINLLLETLKGKLERMSHLVGYSTIKVRTGSGVRPGPVGYVFYQIYRGAKWLFVRD